MWIFQGDILLVSVEGHDHAFFIMIIEGCLPKGPGFIRNSTHFLSSPLQAVKQQQGLVDDEDEDEDGAEIVKEGAEEWQSEAVKKAIGEGGYKASEEDGAMDVDAAVPKAELPAVPEEGVDGVVAPPAIIMPSQVEDEGETWSN